MIARVKEIMSIKADLDEFKKEARLQKEQAKEASLALRELCASVKEAQEESSKALFQVRKDSKDMQSFKEQLAKELYEFKLFKKEVKRKLSEELHSELSTLKQKFSKDIYDFNELKKKINSKTQDLEKLESEIRRLSLIAEKIKDKDFEMARAASLVRKSEKEKADLLRKLDSLERLCANLRKRRP
mgnify:CR=1 FL=1